MNIEQTNQLLNDLADAVRANAEKSIKSSSASVAAQHAAAARDLAEAMARVRGK